MLERVLIAGSGGQGIIVTGKILASASTRTLPCVTFFPSYGAEVRGGTSNCQIVLSTNEIPCPVPSRVDSMIIMNQPSMDRYRKMLVHGGLMIVNATLCVSPAKMAGTIAVPATGMAERLGNIKAANMILLGVYAAHRKVIPAEHVEAEIRAAFSERDARLLSVNLEAFRAGLAYGRNR